MMEVDGLLDDRQAEAGTLDGGRALFERLQEIGDDVVAQPGPIVLDDNGAGGTRDNIDVSPRRRMANSVLQEVAQGLAYGDGVADDGGRFPHGDGNFVLCARGPVR